MVDSILVQYVDPELLASYIENDTQASPAESWNALYYTVSVFLISCLLVLREFLQRSHHFATHFEHYKPDPQEHFDPTAYELPDIYC